MDLLSILNEKLFLGQEFLTWLWWLSEQEGPVQLPGGRNLDLLLGDRLTLGPAQGREGSRVSVRGHEASLAEAREGLRQGKLVESLRLGLLVEDQELWLTLNAAELGVSSLRLPPTRAGGEKADDQGQGAWLERIALVDLALTSLDGLFSLFLRGRLEPGENPPLRSSLRAWIEKGE